MKKILLIICVITGFLAQGQMLQLGVKGGFNYPDFKLSNDPKITDFKTRNGGGFHVGGMLRIKLLPFYVQPELLYTRVQTDFAMSTTSMLTEDGTYVTQRIDIPINVGLNLGPIAIFAGPVASFQINSPSQIFDNSYKTSSWGYQAGVGVKLKKFLAEVKYEGAFNSQANSATIQGQEFVLDARMSQVILSFGYFLGDQ